MRTSHMRWLRWVAPTAAVVLALVTGLWAARSGVLAGPDPAPPAGIGGDTDGMDMGGMDMGGDGTVRIEPSLARSLGVTVVAAELDELRHSLRTTGHVTYDETRLSTISPKFGGFVERLHVNFSGQAVARGQPLLEIYSPELVSAQEELLAAVRLERQLVGSVAPGLAERSGGLVESARRRLLLWDISPAQVERIERTGEVRRTLTLHAPFSGVVTEQLIQAGQAVQAGTALYRLADLTRVWVEADVHERDLRFIRTGEPAHLEIAAYPGAGLTGRVSYVYPDVRVETRTARVRIELDNPDGRIKPGMFATVHLAAPVAERTVMIPRDAVLRGGERDLVFVQLASGVFETREVRVGADQGDRTQILSGLLAGERVVARANFILDAESRLMEAMLGQPDMPGMETGGGQGDSHLNH